MRDRRETLIGLLDGVTDKRALEQAIPALAAIFEVQHTMYHVIGQSGSQIGIGTYSEEWQKTYVAANFARVDPVIRSCLHARGPIHWNRLDWSSPGATRFLSGAVEAGVGTQGLSVPLRGQGGEFAVFTVSDRPSEGEWDRHCTDFETDIVFAAQLLNEKGLAIVDGAAAKSRPSLSPREGDVLCLLATGLTRTQAADYLGISEHTVRVYLETARRKVGATNTLHTVARAQSLGLLAL